MPKFYFITHDNTDAYFNLASEEYLLKQTDNYYIYLWVNDRAVIVGTNQNAIEEVNLAYTEKAGVKVVRRLTGGGTVYHDKGNICYTVIAPYNQNEEHYKKFTAPIIEYLNSLGVNAKFSGRNDITIDDKKISGNAQTVYKDRIMHHGTILYNTDSSELAKCLNPSKLKMQSKGIKSVRARVTNVIEHLEKKMTVDEFKTGLKNEFLKSCTPYEFTDEDLTSINKLVEEKYSKYEWNIGRSPVGANTFTEKFEFGILTLTFSTKNGVVSDAEIFGDFFEKKPIKEFANTLNGIKFSKADFEKAFSNIGDYISGASAKQVVDKIFE
ncbi:MAG: lipoate--protein ligase [Clostridiales bacterium]|nr:lipoate--protein ligase [Clostridiales bacterium]